ncbi:uncharacterized protein N7503_007763 [Penicillium pulvis]|uniref:uncharacterized protein n=1 Tax=Penicillium pulvis TaxID=1562058 RepID=UPI00254693B3|nr:uncharacterized protein N7503_007763 [Penicillium pulvis]KAJ5798467.1 hypothetical protein N7503_007763 [Penicillium pulvis]
MARLLRKRRDRKEALGQAKALGSPVPRAQSYNLVACTSHNAKADGWIFSDFMGACMLLLDRHVKGDFYSCFPVKEHFEFLAKQPTAIDTIKFGYFGKDRAEALYQYTKDQFDKGDRWWVQVKPGEIRRRIDSWISQKSKLARDGDFVNIFLDGHGHRRHGLKAGSEYLHQQVFAQQISHFCKGVQVNLIMDFCHSGLFKKAVEVLERDDCYIITSCGAPGRSWSNKLSGSGRHRNGRFATALVHAFTSGGPKTPPYSIQDQEDSIRNRLTRDVTPEATVSSPEFWSGDSVKPTDSVDDIFFRNMVNVSSHGHYAAGRNKRVEWPTTNQAIRSKLGNATGLPLTNAVTAVSKLVKDEIYLCDVDLGYPPDMEVYSQVSSTAPDYRGLVRNLYWRARRQSTVWNIYLLLIEYGLIDFNALVTPMDLLTVSNNTDTVAYILSCFSNVDQDVTLIAKDKIAFQGNDWSADIEWLATLIVRGGCDYLEIFQAIIDSRYLGTINACGSDAYKSLHLDLDQSRNLQEREGTWTAGGDKRPNRNVFGFWLPHGLSVEDAKCLTKSGHGDCLDRFDEIERMFCETEGIAQASLSDDTGEEVVDSMAEIPKDFISACLVSEDDIIPSWLNDLKLRE